MIRPIRIVELLVFLCAATGVFPLYPHLELLPKLMLPAFAVTGIVIRQMGIRVPRLLLTFVSIGLFIYYSSRFGHNALVSPASNLLAALLAVLLAGERSSRTSLQICALSIFCLAASTLFTLGPIFLFSLTLLSVIVISTLVLLTFHAIDQSIALSLFEIHSLGKLVLLTMIATVPLMLIFFIILPRTQFPLWNAFASKGMVSSGMSERVEPGRAERIEENRAVAFRSEMPAIDSGNLYWRCVIFNVYRSGAWVRDKPPTNETGIAGPGERIQQTIYIEPGRFRYLPALDLPLQIQVSRLSASGDMVVTQTISSANISKYQATSIPGDTLKNRTAVDRNFYLRLPSSLPPRLAEAAIEIGRRGKSGAERLSLAREFFISKGLRYATKNLPTGDNHLDRFLFEQKQGHCEYFASSFAIFMRKAGVPARVVGGYYGGIYNQLGGYYVVSEEMAHAWTEVFIDGEGWKRIDPSRWSAGFADIGTNRGKRLATRLSTLLDTFAYYWNVMVIAYDLSSQLHLARSAGELLRHDKTIQTSLKILYIAFLIIPVAICLCFLKRLQWARTDKQLALNFIRLAGYESPPKGKGILDIATEWGDGRAERFASIYADAIYKDRKISATERRELSSLLGALKALKSKA